MKSRETLIRLKKFQVDDKRRRVAQIEGMIAEFERMATDLDREIEAEQTRAGIHDPAHYAYPTYAKAAMQRRQVARRSARFRNGCGSSIASTERSPITCWRWHCACTARSTWRRWNARSPG